MGEFQKSKSFFLIFKKAHENFTASHKYKSFPQFFKISHFIKKIKMTKIPSPYDKFLSFINFFLSKTNHFDLLTWAPLSHLG